MSVSAWFIREVDSEERDTDLRRLGDPFRIVGPAVVGTAVLRRRWHADLYPMIRGGAIHLRRYSVVSPRCEQWSAVLEGRRGAER